jgi:hypothetical protein
MGDWFKLVTHFSMNNIELILAVTGAALQALLILLLLWHRYFREFRFFGLYLLFSVLSTTLGLVVRNDYQTLFYVYWISEAVYVVVAFLVLQEAFRSVFRNFYTLRWFKLSFPGVGILIGLLALLRAEFFRPPNHSRLAVTLISLEIAIGFLQFGVFCLFIVLVRFFHMRWRLHAFGIVLGFGIASAGSLVAFLLRSDFGTNLNQMVRIATPLSYIIGVAIWLATFLKAEPGRTEAAWSATLTPAQMIKELKRHTETVKGILGR